MSPPVMPIETLNKRILKVNPPFTLQESERLLSDPVPGIQAQARPENLRHFDVQIMGPEQTPYSGGTFKLELFLPEEYPMEAPKVRFLTPIYHPNIDRLGRICLDILKGKANTF